MDTNSSNLENIQNEYQRIDQMWSLIQYRLMIGLALFAFAAEVVMCLILYKTNLFSIPLTTYVGKYLLFPSGCCLLLVLAAWTCMKSHLLPRQKTYILSLLITAMAFLLYTVHSIFPSLFLIFLIPMVLTIIYGDLFLTTLVGFLSIVGKVTSDLFLFWDPGRPSVLRSHGSLFDFGLSILLLFLFYCLCCFLLSTERRKNEVSIKLERERELLWTRSMIDPLTAVGSRQALRETFLQLEQKKTYEHVPLSLAVMDLDDFKSLNDKYGHGVGDQYLHALGKTLLSVACDTVHPFRFGGDEFCLLFYGHSKAQVQQLCQKIQEAFLLETIQRSYQKVTISIGIAEYSPDDTLNHLFNKADKALYQAKGCKGVICFNH